MHPAMPTAPQQPQHRLRVGGDALLAVQVLAALFLAVIELVSDDSGLPGAVVGLHLGALGGALVTVVLGVVALLGLRPRGRLALIASAASLVAGVISSGLPDTGAIGLALVAAAAATVLVEVARRPSHR